MTVQLWNQGSSPYNVVMGPPPPPTLRPATIMEPINLLPGYEATTTRGYMAINGTPAFDAATVILDDPGYYEIDVGDLDGIAVRYPICIVDPTALKASIQPPAAGLGPAFARLSRNLDPIYPRGRVLPSVADHSAYADVATDRAVYLEIRARQGAANFVRTTNVLASGPGTWRSGGISAPWGIAELRLAVVLADQDLVLS